MCGDGAGPVWVCGSPSVFWVVELYFVVVLFSFGWLEDLLLFVVVAVVVRVCKPLLVILSRSLVCVLYKRPSWSSPSDGSLCCF